MAQWQALRAFTAKAPGSIPGWRTKILQAEQHRQKDSKIIIMCLMKSHFNPQNLAKNRAKIKEIFAKNSTVKRQVTSIY